MKLDNYDKHLGTAVHVVPRKKKGGGFEDVVLTDIGFLPEEGQLVIADFEVKEFFSSGVVIVRSEAELAWIEKKSSEAKAKGEEFSVDDDFDLEDETSKGDGNGGDGSSDGEGSTSGTSQGDAPEATEGVVSENGDLEKKKKKKNNKKNKGDG